MKLIYATITTYTAYDMIVQSNYVTMNENSKEYVKKCPKCQLFSKIPRVAPKELTQMQSPWPFAVWGIGLIRKLPTGRGGVQFAVVSVD